MFETSGKIYEKNFKELSKFMFTGKQKMFFSFIFFIGIFDIIMGIKSGSDTIPIFGVLVIILGIVEIRLILKKIGKDTFRRLKEMTGKDYIDYTTSFSEKGVHVYDGNTGGTLIVPYGEFRSLCETKSYFVLITAGWQPVFIFKNQLSQEDHDCFKDFIKRVIPGIKIS